MPLPRKRSFLPLDVPGGTFTSALPSTVGTVGTVNLEPRAIARLDLARELGVVCMRRCLTSARSTAVRIFEVFDAHAACAAARTARLLLVGKELPEQVVEIEHAGATAAFVRVRHTGPAALLAKRARSNLVVELLLLRVAEDVVRVRDLLEPCLLRLVTTGGIGVVLLRELPVLLLDLVGRRLLGNAERFVVIGVRIEVDLRAGRWHVRPPSLSGQAACGM